MIRIPGMVIFWFFCLFITQADLLAQKKGRQPGSQIPNPSPLNMVSDSLFPGLRWRNIGPTRGGRVTTVCGVIQDPYTFYMGSTGGGVWKTNDGGASWRNISDGFFRTGSVGAIEVAPSDPNVIYAGMGEAPIRGVMTSHGDGMYRSTDGGLTWQHLGLADARQISQVRVHPQNPDLVYVAVQGSPYMPSEARGVYRSEDGGKNWQKIHFVDSISGVCDFSLDITNPRILYAAYWDHQRHPWQMRSGGKGSSIWKSTDSGENWTRLSTGLPDSIMGKIGIVVSPADNSRVYAIIESDQGGLYRSDNGGKSWSLVNDDRILRARSWYYMHIFADPVNKDKVFVLNAPFLQSMDGGRSFRPVSTPHGDNHDLWIHPDNPMIMINGNDGGANISYNGGRTWSTQSNQPTAQFYRVNADHQFPYHVYGGQQDNSTVAVPSAAAGPGIPFKDFYPVGGCESAYTAFDPDDPRFVYSGCYQGIITEYDTRLRLEKDIMAYPHLGLGENPADMRYRFNWNAPIVMSQHDKSVIYHAANQVLKTSDRGISWQEISPDLTRNDPAKLISGGGPITNEGAGGENYQTIMYLAESPHDPLVIWVGSDDGLVHVTRNGGKDWQNVTPPDMIEGMVNCIEISPHSAGTAFLAYNRYKFNDFTPHVYVTHDFGQSWQDLTNGIGAEAHVRVVREDPKRPGLLYAGTETGLYMSWNGGKHWDLFQLNLPVVPITDLKVHHNDLIAATAGRAFWILDDLTPLQNWEPGKEKNPLLFNPAQVYLWGGPRQDSLLEMGTNPDFGLVAFYNLPDPNHKQELRFIIRNASGDEIKMFSSEAKEAQKKIKPVKPGVNKMVWNLVPDGIEPIKGLMTLGGNRSPRVRPGQYRLEMIYGGDTLETEFTVSEDPRLEVTEADLAMKKDWLEKLDLAANDLTESVKAMTYVVEQIEALNRRLATSPDTTLLSMGKSIISMIDSLKSQLVQEKQKTFQDVINFPNQLDAKIRHIQSIIEESYPPVTNGQRTRAMEVLDEWKVRKERWLDIQAKDVLHFNQAIDEGEIPFITTKIPDKRDKAKP